LAGSVGGAWLLVHHRPRWQTPWIAAMLLVVVGFFAGQEIRDRFISTAQYHSDGSAQSRLQSWSAAWQLTWDAPLTGQGIRNANRFSQGFGADRQGRTIHSQYLQIAADCGLPAMLVYISIVALAFTHLRQSRRMCERSDESEPDRSGRLTARQVGAIALGCEASLVIFAFGAVFLSLEVFELPWLLIALAAAMPQAVRHHLSLACDPKSAAIDHSPPTPAKPSIMAAKGLVQS
jgi:O-antigen ligase